MHKMNMIAMIPNYIILYLYTISTIAHLNKTIEKIQFLFHIATRIVFDIFEIYQMVLGLEIF